MSQRTIAHSVTATGVGLHSGQTVTATLYPAPAGHGIVFQRLDLDNQPKLKAQWDAVIDTQLCTLLGDKSGATVGTVEHIMAALYGQRIDNILITLDAAEVPIMDGSAAPWMFLLDCAGRAEQAAPRQGIEILTEITVQDGDKSVTLSPAAIPSYSFAFDFGLKSAGPQERKVTMVNGNIRSQILRARTFCRSRDIDMMREAGLIRGGSLHNAIVFDEEKILNATGLRYDDEAVRHKILDAVGDLYLAGMPIIGAYHGHKAGHTLNNKILHALFAQPESYRLVTLD
ncbi:MAG TPA: UDP-3-O-acyl-N-acetylglucosamine deacetylase [Alphaproteobacteria bacterium]